MSGSHIHKRDDLEQFLYDTGLARPGDVRAWTAKIRSSDWLARVKAEAAATALEDAATDLRMYANATSGSIVTWLKRRATELRVVSDQ